MKPFPPVMRERRRYIAFQVKAEKPVTKKEVEKSLWDNTFDYIGLLGAVESSFWLIDFDEETQKGVIRTTNKFTDKLLGILAFVEKVSNKNMIQKNNNHIEIGTLKSDASLLGAAIIPINIFFNAKNTMYLSS